MKDKMSLQINTKLYNHLLLLLLLCVQLTYVSCHAKSEIDNNSNNNNNNKGIECMESERDALLEFKSGIHVDRCGFLDSWGVTEDCCMWYGIQCHNHSGNVIALGLPTFVRYPTSAIPEPCLEGKIGVSILGLKQLKYLDLSFNDFGGQIPKFIGSLPNLEYIDLAYVRLTGVIPQQIGNLSKLTSLGLNGNYIRVENLEWLSQLRLLKVVDLSGIDLSVATNSWFSIVNNLPLLQILVLESCNLSLKLPSSLSYTNSSKTLATIDLHENNLNDTSIFEWLSNLNNLVYLDLSQNYQLFQSNSQGTGYAMNVIGKLCSLQSLKLMNTSLNYDLLHIIESLSLCSYKSLMSLDLGGNQVWGSVPDNIGNLSNLRDLHLHGNQLNGTISEALGEFSTLERLSLSTNSLKGVFTSAHLSNLSNLRVLNLGDNVELVVNISADWVPPFQLDRLYMYSCLVGPDFPIWLKTQKNLIDIVISNTGISTMMPVSFFNSLSPKLEVLAMSLNNMYGVLPDVSITFVTPPVFELSSNNFSGAIPSFMRNASFLELDNNNFSQGLVPLLCPQTKMPLTYLALSNNSFSDKLPNCWGYFDKLSNLHLENNKFWGNMPVSIGRLNQLQTLGLSSNNISGELPASLLNCTSLVFLDLSNNSLFGYIPSVLGSMFQNLSILILRDNNFSGALPSSLCHLCRLQMLDFSNNRISGTIPRCIYNLTAMATKNPVHGIIFYINTKPISGSIVSTDNPLIIWKGQEQYIRLVPIIDLSNNMLNGQIPEEMTDLVGLVQINLSRNHLNGVITSSIGQLTSLESLDLSHNHLSGEIPTSLAKISSLEVLDLSYNNLYGEIPIGTQLQSFNTSQYIGNPGLCGAPLPECDADTVATNPQNNIYVEKRNDTFMLGVYISVVLGFIIGFWGVCGTLVIKRSWRHAFFRFYDDVKDRIYVMAVVNMRRVWRRT